MRVVSKRQAGERELEEGKEDIVAVLSLYYRFTAQFTNFFKYLIYC